MRLYLFELGRMRGGEPVPGYLIQTDDLQNVLVDTGYRPGTFGELENPESGFIQVSEDQLVVNQLARLGIEPDDIRYVILTHLDPDHAGFVDAFPSSEIVVQRKHLEFAQTSEEPRFLFTKERWSRTSLRFRFVEGDSELLPGIELIESGGHVPAHQSVLVRLAHFGNVLLAIDAIPQSSMRDGDNRRFTRLDMAQEELVQSTKKLMRIAETEGVKLIVFGHDRQQWETLRLSPEYYA
jgi:N-acyl homoserine lactone hydrolase